MATDSIKLRAKLKDGACTVNALIKHDMETGLRKDKKTGKPIPAHFIQLVECKHNKAVVMSADWGSGVASPPYISFTFDGAKKGDTISLSWVDNSGDSDSTAVKIK